MKKRNPTIYKFVLCLILFEYFLLPKPSNAFLPIINEPNQKEFESTSIQIGKTAIQLIQFGQYNDAIKLLELAVRLNPKEKDLWLSLAEAQIRSNKKLQALSSLNQAIKLKPTEQSIYFRKASIYMDLNNPQEARFSIKKGLSINKNNERGFFQLGNV